MSGIRPLRIAFAGGGTGGHFYPAIAISEALERLSPPASIIRLFFGTVRGIEYRQREKLQLPLTILPVRGLVRRLTLRNLLVPYYFLRSLSMARSELRTFRPDIVVGTGGYVSLPVLTAAGQLGIPYVIQEQNSFPGIATRKAAAKSSMIFTAFPEIREHLPAHQSKIRQYGNPIRGDIGTISRETARGQLGITADETTILILGGSQGARTINDAVLGHLREFPLSADVRLIWQTGERDYSHVMDTLGANAKHHLIFPFAAELSPHYAAADIALCRAGALTLAELDQAALPAIVIPYPFAAANHQEKNARSAEAIGAVRLCLERELDSRQPLQEALAMVTDGTAAAMRDTLLSASKHRPAAAERIARDILGLIHSSQGVVA